MGEYVIRNHKPVCCHCEEHNWPTHYNKKHDAHYCPDCNIWLESQCIDPECEYCVGRPDKPLDIKPEEV
jgi:hypothetical protein